MTLQYTLHFQGPFLNEKPGAGRLATAMGHFKTNRGGTSTRLRETLPVQAPGLPLNPDALNKQHTKNAEAQSVLEDEPERRGTSLLRAALGTESSSPALRKPKPKQGGPGSNEIRRCRARLVLALASVGQGVMILSLGPRAKKALGRGRGARPNSGWGHAQGVMKLESL